MQWICSRCGSTQDRNLWGEVLKYPELLPTAELLLEGCNMTEMAKRLSLSKRVVKARRSRIYRIANVDTNNKHGSIKAALRLWEERYVWEQSINCQGRNDNNNGGGRIVEQTNSRETGNNTGNGDAIYSQNL